MQSLTSTDTLTIKLAATPVINPSFFGAYIDSTLAGGITADASIPPTATTGTTPVTVLAAPTAGTTRHLASFVMNNPNASSITASIMLNGVAGVVFTLQAGETIQYGKNMDQWVVKTSGGADKQALSLNWGQIGGTLSQQADLQAALDAKVDENAAITPSGATNKLVRYDAKGLVVSGVDANAAGVGLGNVTNDAQTKAVVVPNTAPAAGQVLVGNAGGTAYAPKTLSGMVTITEEGVATVPNATAEAAGAMSAALYTATKALTDTEPAALEGTALTDADSTIQPFSDAVSQYQDRATLTQNRTTTLGTTSAVAGMLVRIVRAAGLANTRAIANGGTGGGTLFTFSASAAKAIEATFFYNGAYWLLVGWRYVRGMP